jgi:ABC-type transport system substrate-binding protein
MSSVQFRTATASCLGLLCVVGMLVVACSGDGSARPGSQAQNSPASGPNAPERSASKTLQIAHQGFQEPKSGIVEYGSTGAGGFDPLEHFLMFHASLTVYDQQGRLVPRLAEKLPSTAEGDWKLLPDGRMEVTWKLKPNLTWHDGTPLSADDFVFGAQVVKDPQIPASRPPWAPLVTTVQAPDARTLVVTWR